MSNRVACPECKDETVTARPAFSESFSQELPKGWNLGAHYFFGSNNVLPPNLKHGRFVAPISATIGLSVSGNKASEVTSLGCHTIFESDPSCQFSSFL